MFPLLVMLPAALAPADILGIVVVSVYFVGGVLIKEGESAEALANEDNGRCNVCGRVTSSQAFDQREAAEGVVSQGSSQPAPQQAAPTAR